MYTYGMYTYGMYTIASFRIGVPSILFFYYFEIKPLLFVINAL